MPWAILDQLETFGPARCPQLDYQQAAAYTRRLTRRHYENFTVVSWLLPRRLRDDFRHVYAFCRWADDLGDQTGDPRQSLELLDWWRQELDRCYQDRPRHPVFVALHRTIGKHDVPRKPFDDLIDAFVQDQRVSGYENWAQVLDYCTRSADPVGRLVLYMLGYRDEQRQRLSDAPCTALQLANFWQDVRRDILERDRVYIPRDAASRHGLDIEQMARAVREHQAIEDSLRQAYCATIRELVDRTWPLFEKGRGLWPLIEGRVRTDVKLFSLGGESILRLIQRRGYDTLSHRPVLSRWGKIALLVRSLLPALTPRIAY